VPFNGAALQGAFAYLSVWFLLLAGVRPVLELQGKRRRGEALGSAARRKALDSTVWPPRRPRGGGRCSSAGTSEEAEQAGSLSGGGDPRADSLALGF